MSAVPDNIVQFTLPKKPRIKEKDAPPDQRKVCILPIRAVFDKQMTHGALQALAALCAYCNRAGITWVSQTRLASELGISQQAVAKQFKQLRELGYLETVRRGFKGERTDTLRVIFDPSITAEEAITMTSNKEDTRPPAIREEQERQASQEIDREGQARIAKLISQALKQPTKPKGYAMPAKGETRAVREVKEAMQKAQSKRSKPVNKSVDKDIPIHNPQVVNEEAVHSQPNHNPEVVLNSEELYIDKELKVIKVKDSLNNIRTVLNNQEIEKLIDNGMTVEQVREAEELIAPLFAAEGLTPSSTVMSQAILQMHRDAR